VYAERLLPNDPVAEEAVVGSILIDDEALAKVTSLIKPGDFYMAKSRWCYEACLTLFDRREAINQVTIAHELALRGKLEDVGGAAYLAHLVRSVPTSVHIAHYAGIVQRTSVMRQLISAASDIAAIGYEGAADTDAALSRAEDLLFKVRTGKGTRDFVQLREVLDQYMEEMASLDAARDQHLAPVSTGFLDMDKLLGGGLQRSDMVVLAARPSLGKSTLAFNIARNAAEQGMVTGIFSLEMSARQIAVRLLASEAKVDSHRMRIGMLSEAERQRELDAIGTLSELPIYIDDTPFQGIVEMRGKVRRLQMERGLDFVIIDYLQLIMGSGRTDNRVQEMGEISRSIKGVARELDVPILALSQLSRAVEQRPNHRPMLSDLRESGSIEQDADVVAFIHREDKYMNRDEWAKSHPSEPFPENIAEIIFAKHRNGPVGTVPLYFRNDLVRFENATLQHRSREFA